MGHVRARTSTCPTTTSRGTAPRCWSGSRIPASGTRSNRSRPTARRSSRPGSLPVLRSERAARPGAASRGARPGGVGAPPRRCRGAGEGRASCRTAAPARGRPAGRGAAGARGAGPRSRGRRRAGRGRHGLHRRSCARADPTLCGCCSALRVLQHTQSANNTRNADGWLSTGGHAPTFRFCVVSRGPVIDTRGDDVTRRWSLRLMAGLLVGIAVLSGCSEKQEANDSLPTSTTATPTEEELPPLGPEDLPMPAEARTQDAAGAEAFVRYYIELINRTSDVMDAEPLREFSDGCQDCDRIATDTDEDAAAGLRLRGRRDHPHRDWRTAHSGRDRRSSLCAWTKPRSRVSTDRGTSSTAGSDAYSDISGRASTLEWDDESRVLGHDGLDARMSRRRRVRSSSRCAVLCVLASRRGRATSRAADDVCARTSTLRLERSRLRTSTQAAGGHWIASNECAAEQPYTLSTPDALRDRHRRLATTAARMTTPFARRRRIGSFE